jgi:hypothetical protein
MDPDGSLCSNYLVPKFTRVSLLTPLPAEQLDSVSPPNIELVVNRKVWYQAESCTEGRASLTVSSSNCPAGAMAPGLFNQLAARTLRCFHRTFPLINSEGLVA